MKPMEPLDAAQFFCPRCSAEVAATAKVCPGCGAVLAAAPPSAAKPARQEMLDNPWVVLGLLFLAMAVLGLPLLWRSRAFTTRGKIVITIVVTIYTFALVAMMCWAVWWGWKSVQEAISLATL